MASSIAAEHSSKSDGAGRPSQKAHKSPLCDLRLSEEWHANGRPTKRPAPRDEEAEDRLILQADAEPAEQDDAAAVAEEDDVVLEIEDGNGQDGNQRREEWAALARRCTFFP